MRVLLVLLALSTACRANATATPTTACRGLVTDAAWLTGAWRSKDGAEEQWTSAAGRTMLGLGRTVVQGGTMAFEFMRIEERADGLVFIAHPSAGPGVEFPRTACAPGLLRFENPKHDFPQLIEYRRTGADTIEAKVGGPDRDGGQVGQVIEYRREARR